MIDLCGRRAGLRAGYSPKTVDAIATELLQLPAVQAEIARLLKERSERTRITADRVLEELAVIAFSDIGDYGARDDGRMYLTPGARSDARRAVSSVKRMRKLNLDTNTITTTVEFKLWEKGAALRALMPHVGLATESHQHTGRNGGPIEHRVTLTPEERAARIEDLLDTARRRAAASARQS